MAFILHHGLEHGATTTIASLAGHKTWGDTRNYVEWSYNPDNLCMVYMPLYAYIWVILWVNVGKYTIHVWGNVINKMKLWDSVCPTPHSPSFWESPDIHRPSRPEWKNLTSIERSQFYGKGSCMFFACLSNISFSSHCEGVKCLFPGLVHMHVNHEQTICEISTDGTARPGFVNTKGSCGSAIIWILIKTQGPRGFSLQMQLGRISKERDSIILQHHVF